MNAFQISAGYVPPATGVAVELRRIGRACSDSRPRPRRRAAACSRRTRRRRSSPSFRSCRRRGRPASAARMPVPSLTTPCRMRVDGRGGRRTSTRVAATSSPLRPPDASTAGRRRDGARGCCPMIEPSIAEPPLAKAEYARAISSGFTACAPRPIEKYVLQRAPDPEPARSCDDVAGPTSSRQLRVDGVVRVRGRLLQVDAVRGSEPS